MENNVLNVDSDAINVTYTVDVLFVSGYTDF